ncbi:phytoene/squalene synthase family protein [Halobacteriales archaeon Cl-PHB]
MNASQIARSREIHRQTGTTFYYATRLLPDRVRDDVYVLYAFFRVADEVVDGDEFDTPAAQRRRLAEIREAALGNRTADEPVVAAFADLRERADIPRREVSVFLDAMAADLDRDRYETHGDVEDYMRGSAVAVGHMVTAVMDPADPETARPHAAALGEALQLTNFCRDVREDRRELGRVYLPEATLTTYGVAADALDRETASPALRSAIRHELRRAEERYRTGVAGIEHLPTDCQFPVLLAAVLYAEHHRLVRRQDFDTLARRPSLSTARKLAVVARTAWHWRRIGDPVTVFRKVSAVPSREEVVTEPDGESVAVPRPE